MNAKIGSVLGGSAGLILVILWFQFGRRGKLAGRDALPYYVFLFILFGIAGAFTGDFIYGEAALGAYVGAMSGVAIGLTMKAAAG